MRITTLISVSSTVAWLIATPLGAQSYEKATSGTRELENRAGTTTIRMLVEEANLGGTEVEVGEIVFAAGSDPQRGHAHGSVEIFYILEGVLEHVVNGVCYTLTPGMVGIVRPGDEVVHRVPADADVKALVIWAPGGEAARIGPAFKERPLGIGDGAGTPSPPGRTRDGAAGQSPSIVELTADATLPEPYSRVRGLVALPDGRVIVADQTENALYLASFDGSRRRTLGGNGQGPHEYSSLVGLFPGWADTALAYDIKNARLALATPGGIAGVVTFRELGHAGYPHFVDLQRRLYWDDHTRAQVQKARQPGTPGADRAWLMRTDGAGGVDTLAALAVPGPAGVGPTPEWDFWAAAGDGRLAIVRNQDEYRVDWIAADGTLSRGPVVDEDRVPLGRVDRDSLRNTRMAGAAIGAGGSGGRRDAPLPDRFPYAKSVAMSAAGRLWVERSLPVREVRRLYDVFDGAGRRVARYRLPPGREVVGYGPGVVYATREDDVGFRWVERYPIPSTPPGPTRSSRTRPPAAMLREE